MKELTDFGLFSLVLQRRRSMTAARVARLLGSAEMVTSLVAEARAIHRRLMVLAREQDAEDIARLADAA